MRALQAMSSSLWMRPHCALTLAKTFRRSSESVKNTFSYKLGGARGGGRGGRVGLKGGGLGDFPKF